MKMSSRWLVALCVAAAVPVFAEQSQTKDAAPAANAAAAVDLDKHLGTRWYSATLSNKKVGYASARMAKTTVKGQPAYSSSMKITIVLAAMGQAQELSTTEKNVYLATGPLVESSASMGIMGEFTGVVEGDKMRLTSVLGGAKSEKLLPAPAVSLADEIAPLRLILGKPKAGDSVDCSTFDPTAGKTISGKVTVMGTKKMLVHGVDTTVYDVSLKLNDLNFETPMLIDENGEVLEMSMPVGTMKLVLRRTEEKQAMDRSTELVEMLDASTVRPVGDMPDLAGLEVLKLKVSGIADEKCILNDARQKYTKQNGAYELTLQRDSLPEKPVTIPVKDPAVEQFTKSSEIYQSDNPELSGKAREIVGDETNAAKTAQKLCLWVFTNVKKKGTLSFSNSLETLHTMEGDCTEHSALYVGLCRAVGLPAKMVNGLAYSKTFGAFGGHAWAEVYVGKWVAVDPTFGEPIANPAHIKLVDSDTYLESARLLGVVGKLKIEVVKQNGSAGTQP